MPTGIKKGLTPGRRVGSAVNNGGLNEYQIASGYGTAIGKNDPVKLTTDGTLIKATNNTDDSIGVFMGVSYTDQNGEPKFSKYWPASQVATDVKALVCDDPMATFTALADGPVDNVVRGNIYAMTLTAPDTFTGQSTAVVATTTVVTGDVDIEGETDLGTNTAGVTDGNTFTIATTNPDNTPVTITIADGDGADELLAKLNDVTGISAVLNADGFVVLTATDGYGIVTADTGGTPFAGLFPGSAGTFNSTVAASAGLVKVIKVTDVDTRALEVTLVDHDLRDDG